MSESFAQLFEESLNQTEMTAGQVVLGTVTDIRDGYVIVSAGLKSEGVIPEEQFKNLNGELEVAIGDDVDVGVLRLGGGRGGHAVHRRGPAGERRGTEGNGH